MSPGIHHIEVLGGKEQRDGALVGVRRRAELRENGTGPFTITEQQPGVRTVFKKNLKYWGKVESNLDEAIFTPIANDATGVAALISDEVDWIDPVPSQDQQRVNTSGTAVVMAGPEVRTIDLGMDQSRDVLTESIVKDTPNPILIDALQPNNVTKISMPGLRVT